MVRLRTGCVRSERRTRSAATRPRAGSVGADPPRRLAANDRRTARRAGRVLRRARLCGRARPRCDSSDRPASASDRGRAHPCSSRACLRQPVVCAWAGRARAAARGSARPQRSCRRRDARKPSRDPSVAAYGLPDRRTARPRARLARRLRPRRGGPATDRSHAPARRGNLELVSRRATAGPGCPGRGVAARRDAQRDAVAPGRGSRARAALRLRREPPAADAAGAAEDRTRARPQASTLPGGTRADDALRGRERRAARASRRRPASPRACGGGARFAQGDADPLVISADRLRLEQALTNLVDNALRHGSGNVTMTARVRNATAELHVLDEGPGFPEDFLGRAFERFSRSDASAIDGSGLGLAIVETIARAHDGRAHAANRPEGGADVWLALPLRPVR